MQFTKSGVAGIAFAISFVVSILLIQTPDTEAPVSEWTEYFQDSGNRALAIVSAYAMVLAALTFLYFIWALTAQLRAVDGDGTDWSTLAVASAVGLVTLMLASGAAMATVPAGVEFGDVPVPDGEFARQLEQLGFGLLLLGGMVLAGVCIAAVSMGALLTGMLPRWLAIAGFVVAVVVGLGGVFFVPMILLVLWALVVGIFMLRPPSLAPTFTS
jgi:hypothetical protein